MRMEKVEKTDREAKPILVPGGNSRVLSELGRECEGNRKRMLPALKEVYVCVCVCVAYI